MDGSERKSKMDVTELLFNHSKLQPHNNIPGVPIRIREMKKQTKREVRRRNAVLLESDIHYERLLKEMKKDKGKKTNEEAD